MLGGGEPALGENLHRSQGERDKCFWRAVASGSTSEPTGSFGGSEWAGRGPLGLPAVLNRVLLARARLDGRRTTSATAVCCYPRAGGCPRACGFVSQQVRTAHRMLRRVPYRGLIRRNGQRIRYHGRYRLDGARSPEAECLRSRGRGDAGDDAPRRRVLAAARYVPRSDGPRITHIHQLPATAAVSGRAPLRRE